MKKILCLIFVLCFALLLPVSANAAEELSLGRKYSLITPASKAFPDNGTKLTDGIYATLPDNTEGYYASPAYVGFSMDETDDHGNYVIILDLGEERKNITEITIGYLNERVYGIYAPKSISYAMADTRNGDYDYIGTVNINPEIDGETAGPLSKGFAANNASGRFLKVTITPGIFENPDTNSRQTAKWTFIDEISVRSNPVAHNDSESKEESPEASDDTAGDTPQAGDNSLRPIAYILLAVSAVAMLVSLFVKKKPDRY